MQITLLTIGAMGDTQPFVALAVRLKQEGHQVKLAARPDFASLAAGYGVDFAPLGNPYRPLLADAGGTLIAGNPVRLLRESLKRREALFERLDEDMLSAVKGAQAVVFKSSWIPFYSLCEKLGVPCAGAMLFPLTPTRAFPSFLLGDGASHGRLLDGALWRLTEQVVWRVARRFDGKFRREVLHLAPLPFWGPAARQERQRMPLFYAYSPTLLPRPSDWPERIHVTGFWFSDPPSGWHPPADLQRFLATGPPPVYIGFGSMPTQSPEAMLDMIIEALDSSGQRGIVLSGWAGIGQGRRLPDHVLGIENVPHSWLFPRMAAVVHHGGAGTTGAGLRSGVPSIITPFTVDQPSWARRVAALAVGPTPIPCKALTAENLARAIHTAVTDRMIRQHAAELGARIQMENGLGETIALMRRYKLLP